VFGMTGVPGEDDKLKMYTIKARHGPMGQTQELRVDAAHCLIASTKDIHNLKSPTDLSMDLNMPVSEIAKEIDKQKHPNVDFKGLDLDFGMANGKTDTNK